MLPVTFAEFDEDDFPIHITWHRGEQVIHGAEISGPGALVVPALGDISHCVVRFNDGTVVDTSKPD